MQKTPEQTEKTQKLRPAGPHDRPELTNPDATPGTGMLPAQSDEEHLENMQPTS